MPETTRTPTGDYPKPAKAHHLDLTATADRLLQKLPGHGRHTESLAREAGVSVLLVTMEAGNVMPEHAANGVVSVHLLQGRADLTSEGGEQFALEPGGMVVFQPNVRHEVSAREQSVLLVTITGGDD